MIQDFIVDLNNYTIQKKIGEGQYSSVHLVRENKTGKYYAAKVSKNQCLSVSDQNAFFKELTIFSKVKNPAVLTLEGFNMTSFKRKYHPTIIIPYMTNGSLDKLIKNNPEFPMSKRYIILLGIAIGMKYLHSIKICHRDLKPANVLLDDNFYPHIGDFGESKISELTKTAILMNTFTGSPAFMAPEILSDKDYTYKIDIYAYSILMYTLITGKDPYPEYKSIVKFSNAICGGKRPDLTYIRDEHIKNFLKKCWSQNSEERPSFEEIVEELKSTKFRKSMLAKTDEVNLYLQLFGEKLEETEEDNNSIEDIKIKADNGDDRAMLKYALILYKGAGVPVNKKEAARYFKMSADKGNIDAMHKYAVRLFNGEGVPINKEEAVKYFKMSADKGNTDAMYKYAIRLSKGEGVPINKKEAARYLKMSADKGNAIAMSIYAFKLINGDGVRVNKKEAARYYKMSADKENTKAMLNYAIMLENGNGIPPNKEEAICYYKMAKEKGNLKAKRKLSNLLNGDRRSRKK